MTALNEQKLVIGYPKFVPYLEVDENPDDKLSNRLEKDFKNTLCEKIYIMKHRLVQLRLKIKTCSISN